MAGYQWKGTRQGPDLFDTTEPQPKPAETKPKIEREPRPLRPCGTRAAYDRHLARKETPCDACKTAEAAHRARRRAARATRKQHATTRKAA